MTELQVVTRIIAAFFIGGVIGWERGNANKKAGLRTHIIVSVGASVAMILGEWYALRSISSDATRIAGQVISGVGFLGAGTIIHEGFSVRGLTTAASIWTTACLGLAAGAGFFSLSFYGMVAVFFTLSIFERIERKLIYKTGTSASVKLICDSPSETIESVGKIAFANYFIVHRMSYNEKKNGSYELKFEIFSKTSTLINENKLNDFIVSVSALNGIRGIDIFEF